MPAKRTTTKPATRTAKPKTTPTTPSFEWPEKPGKLLLDYLKAEVTDAPDAPNRAKPFINSSGVLHLHSTDWRAWLEARGLTPSKTEAAAPLREAGLKVRAFPLPGESRSLGFYIGAAPKGTEKLPRRASQRRAAGSRPFGKLTDEQHAELVEALTARPKGEVRDALLEALVA